MINHLIDHIKQDKHKIYEYEINMHIKVGPHNRWVIDSYSGIRWFWRGDSYISKTYFKIYHQYHPVFYVSQEYHYFRDRTRIYTIDW